MPNTCEICMTDSEGKWLEKYLPYWTLKSYWCLLTYWQPMRTIPLGILGICSSSIKCIYLENGKLFLNIFFHLWNVPKILKIFEEKMILIANVFPKLQTVKPWVDQSVKSAVSEHPLAVNTLKGPKQLWNLHESNFIIFFDHSEVKWLRKYLPYLTLKL